MHKKLNISFDLDSTLIPNGKEFETEKQHSLAKILKIETIRKGSKTLISDLQQQGHKIHIYTTSFRSKRKIKRTLKYYGIKVDRIINEKENRKVLNSLKINASKYPPAFGFDVHIDDLEGVNIEGNKFNFNVIVVQPSDKNWIQTIKNRINSFKD